MSLSRKNFLGELVLFEELFRKHYCQIGRFFIFLGGSFFFREDYSSYDIIHVGRSLCVYRVSHDNESLAKIDKTITQLGATADGRTNA